MAKINILKGRESVAQYILRNPFSVEKMTYNDQSGTVIYQSKMTHWKNKKNFNVYTAEEFIAVMTQHIPEKSFQTCLPGGRWSDITGDIRISHGDEPLDHNVVIEIIDVSEYEPGRKIS